MNLLFPRFGFKITKTKFWLAVLVFNLLVLVGLNLWSTRRNLPFYKNFSDSFQTAYQTKEDIDKTYEKLGTLEPVKIINRYLLIDTFEGKQPVGKIVHSNYTARQVYFKYVYENFDDYILFLDKDFMHKYNKTSKSLQTVALPLNNEVSFFSGVGLTKDLVVVSFNVDYTAVDVYLLDLKTNKFTKLDIFSEPENCPKVHCTGPSESYQVSDNYFVLLQGAVDLCWSGSNVYLFNLKNRSITKIIDAPSYCSKNSGNHEFIGASDNKVYIATYVDVLDKNVFSSNPTQSKSYTSLFTIDVFSNEKEVLISLEKMPKDAGKVFFDREKKSILFYVDEYRYYKFDLKSRSITSDLQTSPFSYYERLTAKDSLKLKIIETQLSESTEEEKLDIENVIFASLVKTGEANPTQGIVLSVKGNKLVDYVNTQHWAKLYADYLAQRNSNKHCDIIGDFAFKDINFDKEKKLIFYHLSVNSSSLPTLLCDADIKNSRTLTRSNYKGYINLQTGEVFLEI